MTENSQTPLEAGGDEPVMLIDFSEIAPKDRRVISGRGTGEIYRERKGGDEEFEKFRHFEILIPETVDVVTPSVFAGLIGPDFKRFDSFEEVIKAIKISGAISLTIENFRTAVRSSFAEPLR